MARTASILTLARKLESARASLAAAVTAKQKELAQLDAALQRVLGGGGTSTGNGRVARTPGRRGRRGRRSSNGQLRAGSLPAVIVEVLSKAGKSATIDAVLKGAKAAGYKSKAPAKTQKLMVNATLSKLVKTGHARKVARGQYAAKA